MKLSNRITAEILIEVPRRFPARVWRSNAGGGVGMGQVRAAIAAIRARNYEDALEALQRPIKFGVEGQADVSGIIRTPSGIGAVLAIEVKAGDDRQRPAQEAFEKMILAHGGCYVLAGSCDEAIRGISAWLEKIGVKNGR